MIEGHQTTTTGGMDSKKGGEREREREKERATELVGEIILSSCLVPSEFAQGILAVKNLAENMVEHEHTVLLPRWEQGATLS
jgi:hypothetical protein